MKNLLLALGGVALMSASTWAADPALERLEKSPRHHEWVKIDSLARQVHCFVVYPEVKEKAPVVIVIHENRGLNDWARSVADQVAEAGYIAIAPDLLSGKAPGGGNTKDFPDSDAARTALYALAQEQVMGDLKSVAKYAEGLDAANGKVVAVGFCWGGGQAFTFAAEYPELDASFVFYGTAPTGEPLAKIEAPVYGFYGGNDARITAAVPAVEEAMKRAEKKYEPIVYEGAGHGFMRSGEAEDAKPADRQAREQAWERLKKLLKDL